MIGTANTIVDDFTKITRDYPPPSNGAARTTSHAAPSFAGKAGGRLHFIDGLRGAAAVFVMLFHFYTPAVSKLYYILHDFMPGPVDWLLMQGYVGVEIFFVLSGFVIAYTLRNDVCTPGFAANFMIRRSIRLDPPYWTLIFITIGARCVLWHQYAGLILRSWGFGTILLNMFYGADLANRLLVVPVAWTLCLEVQFYLALITMLMLTQQARSRWTMRAGSWTFAVIFVPLTVFSLFYRYGEGKMNFFGTWYMFAMGVTLAWTITNKIHHRWLWVLLGSAFAGELWRVEFRTAIAAATVLLIYTCARFDKMSSWLSWGWIQKLGTISYSLYLCHVAVGTAVIDIFLTYSDKSRFAAVVAYWAAVACSILAASVLHKFVEAPCVGLAKRLKPGRAASPEAKQIVDRSNNPFNAIPSRLAIE